MSVLLAVLVGFFATRFLRISGKELLHSSSLGRTNFRGRIVPTAGGLYIVLGVVLVEAARATVGALGIGETTGLTSERSLVLTAVLGFGFLGLVDDLLAAGTEKGFTGHLKAFLGGHLTTGLVKLVGGGGLAVVLVATPEFALGRGLRDAAIVALAANLANLLDRAPGRTIKAGLVAGIPLLVIASLGPIGVAIGIAPVLGSSLALARDDLRERLMLGDTGANALGAVLGLGVVLGTGSVTRAWVLVGLIILNLLAEVISFSRIIASVSTLRLLDEWGRTQGVRKGHEDRQGQ